MTISGTGPISRAVLRLHVLTDGTLHRPAIVGAANDWDEQTITWSNRPDLSTGPIVAEGDAAPANMWIEYDVSRFIQGDGVYTIAIAGSPHDGLDFGSRESGRGPQLVVVPGEPIAETPVPVAETPKPTSTPSPTDTNEATATSTAIATRTLTATPTSTATPNSTATPTPTQTVAPTATRESSSGQSTSFVLVGDIMDDVLGSAQANDAYTNCAALASEGLPFIALGDTQYDNGEAVLFQENYAPSKCGAIKNSTHPVVGNHEYQTSGASGYYGYFGNLASPDQPGCAADCLGYYAFDAAEGSWRIIVLNTNCDDLAAEHPGDGCASGTAQETWLKAQLTVARGNAQNTLVVSHAPRWSSNAQHSSSSNGYLQALWTDMVDLGADAWIAGHAHDYERFAPQDANGNASAGGLVEIIAGTGGEMDQGLVNGCNDGPSGNCAPNTVELNHDNVGYLKITLSSSGLAYAFFPTVQLFGGAPFHDYGTIAVRR